MDTKSLNLMHKVNRQNRLQREGLVGRVRSKSWGGKPDAQKSRRDWRRNRDIES